MIWKKRIHESVFSFFIAIESSCKGNCALCKKILSLFKEVYCHLLLAIENI